MLHRDLILNIGQKYWRGEIHLGIHPPSNFKNVPTSRSSVIAFNVQEFDERIAKLKALGSEQLTKTHDEGFGRTTTFKDPDGNLVELVELKYDFAKSE